MLVRVDFRNKLSDIILKAETLTQKKRDITNKESSLFKRLKTRLGITGNQYSAKIASPNQYIRKAMIDKEKLDTGESSWDTKQKGDLEDDSDATKESRNLDALHDVKINLTADNYNDAMKMANDLWDGYKKPRRRDGKMYRGTWKNFYKINRKNDNQWKGITMKLVDDSGEVFAVEIATDRMRKLDNAVGGNLNLKKTNLVVELPDDTGSMESDESQSIKIRKENLRNLAKIVQKADSGDKKAQNFWNSLKDRDGGVVKEIQNLIGASSNFGLLGNIKEYLKENIPDAKIDQKDWKLKAKVLGRREYRAKEEEKRRFENQKEYKKKKRSAKEWAKKKFIDYMAKGNKKKT